MITRYIQFGDLWQFQSNKSGERRNHYSAEEHFCQRVLSWIVRTTNITCLGSLKLVESLISRLERGVLGGKCVFGPIVRSKLCIVTSFRLWKEKK